MRHLTAKKSAARLQLILISRKEHPEIVAAKIAKIAKEAAKPVWDRELAYLKSHSVYY